MPILSTYAQKKKIDYFLKNIPQDADILEIGCGSGWVRDYFNSRARINYLGIDVTASADICGDIRDWEKLGLKSSSFDYIIAFEVVEHVDCFQACYDLLKPHGKLFLTSPVPHMDWLLKILERIGLTQKRTSPHDHLIDFRAIPLFSHKEIKIIMGVAQWGIFSR